MISNVHSDDEIGIDGAGIAGLGTLASPAILPCCPLFNDGVAWQGR
jgi:hypothetical protein